MRQRWALLNLLFAQVHRKDFFGRIRRTQGVGRNENLSAAQPTGSISDKISDRPIPVIEVEFLDSADVCILRTELVAFEILGLPQHT